MSEQMVFATDAVLLKILTWCTLALCRSSSDHKLKSKCMYKVHVHEE